MQLHVVVVMHFLSQLRRHNAAFAAAARDVTITPRQRTQTYREITRLRGLPQPTQEQQDRWAQPTRQFDMTMQHKSTPARSHGCPRLDTPMLLVAVQLLLS
jgi:hypothetical protein